MTINEVIKLLQEIRAEHDDLPVYILLHGMKPVVIDEDDFVVEEPDEYWEIPLRLEIG